MRRRQSRAQLQIAGVQKHSFPSATTHLRSPGKIFFSACSARSGQALRALPFVRVPGCPPAQSEQSLQLGSCGAGQIVAAAIPARGQLVCREPHASDPFGRRRPRAPSSGCSICMGGQIPARCAGLPACAPASCMQAAFFLGNPRHM